MPSALIISFVEWSGGFQRPQHLAVGLARRGWNTSYASFAYLHRKRAPAPLAELPAALRVVECTALPGASRLPFVEKRNLAALRKMLLKLQNEPWDLIVFNDPRLAETAAAIPARRRVFDCMDDLSATASGGRSWAETESAALAASDRVWTGTYSLAERLAGRHAHVRFVPCGVDAAHFANPKAEHIARAQAELPHDDKKLRGLPVAGYFGVVNERFDIARVMALIEDGPWRVVLVGPGTSRAPKIPEHPRLRWVGARSYAQLPGYLFTWDAALIPYDTTGAHRFLYPVKALEYLAGGKPVIATPLPDVVRFLGDFVALAETPADWAAAGRRLLDEPEAAKARTARGRAYAAARSWDAMIDEMLGDLEA